MPEQLAFFHRRRPPRQLSPRERELSHFRQAYEDRWGERYPMGTVQEWRRAMRALKLIAAAVPDERERLALLAYHASSEDRWVLRRGHRLMDLLGETVFRPSLLAVRRQRAADEEAAERRRGQLAHQRAVATAEAQPRPAESFRDAMRRRLAAKAGGDDW